MAQRQSGGGSSKGLAAFSAGLARVLAGKHPNSNLVFSPLTIYTALAVVAAGARGATLEEILSVLGTRSREELDEFMAAAVDALRDQSGCGGPRVAFACGVWSDVSCPLKPGFRDAVVDGAYKAEASTVDLRGDPEGACRLINEWVERVTNGLFDSVLSPESVHPFTRVVLGNAVYFKGKWDRRFHQSATENAPFRRPPVDVPFMQSGHKQFVAVHDGFKVLQLWYKKKALIVNPDGYTSSTHFSMCIFLPDADDGLPSLMDAIASRPGFLHQHLPHQKVEVDEFKLPRFKLSFHSSVVGVLNKLGLRLPFQEEAADLSDMTEASYPLVLSDVVHKAVIEVNEEGTEAAAVNIFRETRITCCQRPPPVDFVADHPFAYFIVEKKTGAIVFAGHVLDPSRE